MLSSPLLPTTHTPILFPIHAQKLPCAGKKEKEKEEKKAMWKERERENYDKGKLLEKSNVTSHESFFQVLF